MKNVLARLSVLSIVSAALACNQAAAQQVTIAVASAVSSLDPHYQNIAPNGAMSMNFFDRLVEFDPNGKLQPGLALSWKPLSQTEWEIRLRPNVKWQDGHDFTADDVVYTLTRVPNVPRSPARLDTYLRAIESVKATGPLTVHIVTHGPAPSLMSSLFNISIVSRHATEQATTEAFNSGKALVGSGPYRYVAYTPGERVEMQRNDAWWGPKQPWQKVTFRFIGNTGARAAALLSGEVGVIDSLGIADIQRLKKTPDVSVFSKPGFRGIFLVPDFSHPKASPYVTDNAGKPLASNPLLDRRVRLALSLAIDRTALASQIMQDTVVPASQLLPEGTFGYASDVKLQPVDLAQARQLLMQAGYPQGFHVDLMTPNDRWPNDTATAQVIAQMWARIGVRTTVKALPNTLYTKSVSRQEFGVALWGWGNVSGEPTDVLVNVFESYSAEKRTGASNIGRYANPAFDNALNQALTILDDTKRAEALGHVVKMATGDVAYMPIYNPVYFWAARKDIVMEPRADGRTIAIDVRPAR